MGIRSLFAGVSGLKNFQQQLDIIGNNIANAQTAVFKSSRVTFQDLLSQTARGASSPGANRGGTNPVQFGLGAGLGAVDLNFNQGTLLSTGRQFDIAISGNGLFKVTDGVTDFYTRNGSFDIDEEGFLVATNNGFRVQGFNADVGVLDETSVSDIQVPVGIVLPAQETSTVDVVGNLDSSSEQIGSIFQTDVIFATEVTGQDTDIEGLLSYNTGTTTGSLISGMQTGISTVTFDDGSGVPTSFTYVSSSPGAGQFSSVEDLVGLMDATGASVSLSASGAISITATAGGATSAVSSNSSLNTALAGIAGVGTSSFEFAHSLRTAGDDLVVNLRNSNGDALNLGVGDNINVSADIGGTSQSNSSLTVSGTTDVDTMIQAMNTDLGSLSVSIISGGRVEIEGLGGTNYEIANLDITSDDASGGTAPTNFNNVFGLGNYSQSQRARDNWVTSFLAHDENGAAHTVTTKFNVRNPVGGNAVWVFDVESTEVSSGLSDTVSAGVGGSSSGSIQFNGDGSLFVASPTSFTVNTVGISDPFTLDINFGAGSSFEGLVQFESPASARFTNATGFSSGELQNISINQEGIITGNFTNGQNQTLSQIILSSFDNPDGLTKSGSNLFVTSLNSGVGVDGKPTSGGRGELIPTTLEGSNVDLSEEFVTLITAQRGFQTNARIITTSNEILGELVNLVR